MHLAKSALGQAYRLIHHAQLGSTNDEALSSAAAGDAGRLWIVADEQTKGRGRHGRQWSSPRGNLYASLLLIDPAPTHKAPELGFVTGVALIHALRDVLGSDPLLCIKWPNDILYAGAKLAGILLESTQVKGGDLACVIGIGVNCCSHPELALYPATDLAEIGTLLSHREDVLLRLSETFAQWLDIWDHGRNFEVIRTEWLRYAGGIGTRITVSAPSGPREGVFETIDSTGRLILNVDGEMLTFEAADVFLTRSPLGILANVQQAVAAPVFHEEL